VTTLPPLSIHPVTSVAQATDVLAELGDDAVVYGGGTELLLLMKLRFAAYSHLVDIKPIAELGGIEVTGDGWLRIGGGVTHRAVERSPLVAASWPGLRAMERVVANIRVRTVGSLGGNLAFADPHSDPATFLLAADARIVLGRGDERRTLPIAEFILGPYETALRPGELVVAIEVPPAAPGAAQNHLRFAFHERPAATVSTYLQLDGGRIAEARIAVGSVGVRPVRALAGEALLVGSDAADLDPALLEAAGTAAGEVADAVADANGAADYKTALVVALVGRSVRAAAQAVLAQA
jgi:carbon-monoxide dehydrogenase medium subunit